MGRHAGGVGGFDARPTRLAGEQDRRPQLSLQPRLARWLGNTQRAGTRRFAPGRTSALAHPPRYRPQELVRRTPRQPPAGRRPASVAAAIARTHGSRLSATARLGPSLATGRYGHLGQPLRVAPRPTVAAWASTGDGAFDSGRRRSGQRVGDALARPIWVRTKYRFAALELGGRAVSMAQTPSVPTPM